ncbi:MAG: right-handed parallel beta-helix repeat-containing protein [Promethearchaeota archaeon]
MKKRESLRNLYKKIFYKNSLNRRINRVACLLLLFVIIQLNYSDYIKSNSNSNKEEMILKNLVYDIFTNKSENLKISPSTSTGIIDINNNSMFSSYANGGGNGTRQNPWLIENLTLSCDNSTLALIRIKNTTDFFIIKNCLLVGGGNAIFLEDVSNGLVQNNNITNTTYSSIYIAGLSENITIEKNKISQSIKQFSVACILVDYAKNVSIIGNEIFNNTHFGESAIKFRDASNGTVSSNIIYNNIFDGIIFGHCYDMIVKNNTIFNVTNGIYPQSSWNITLLSNQIYNNYIGIRITGIENYTIYFNTIYNNSKFGIELRKVKNFNISFNNFIENGIIENNASLLLPIVLNDSNGIIDSNFYHIHAINCSDENNDGILDRPYNIKDSNFTDNHPKAHFLNYSDINYLTIPIFKSIVCESTLGTFFSGNITIEWLPSIFYTLSLNSKITYSIWISKNKNSWTKISDFIEDTIFSFNSTNLDDELNYYIRILANNSLGQSSQVIISDINILNDVIPPRIISPSEGSILREYQMFKWELANISLYPDLIYKVYYLEWGHNKVELASTVLNHALIDTRLVSNETDLNVKFIVCAEIPGGLEVCSKIITVKIVNSNEDLYSMFILPPIFLIPILVGFIYWFKNYKKNIMRFQIS